MAVILKDWLPNVLQFVDPYISSDIDKGARWGIDIAQELEASMYGILCVTPENLEASWLMFEAGALSKSLDNSRVSPLLFGLKPSQLKGPILHFQATTAVEKEDVLKLVKSMNSAADESVQLDDGRLNTVFTKWWPDLKASFAKLEPAGAKPVQEPTDPNSGAIEEILSLVREQHRMMKGSGMAGSIGAAPKVPDRRPLNGMATIRLRGNTEKFGEFVAQCRMVTDVIHVTVSDLGLHDSVDFKDTTEATLNILYSPPSHDLKETIRDLASSFEIEFL